MKFEGKKVDTKEIVIGHLIKSYDGKYYIGYLNKNSLSFDGDEVIPESVIFDNKDKKLLIDQASQQLIGYGLGSQGYDIIELVSSMGLEKEEWEILKKDYSFNLKESDNEEINSHFKGIGEKDGK